MLSRRNMLILVVSVIVISLAILALAVRGAGKNPSGPVTAESIGYFDLVQMLDKFPDFIRLKELRTAYDAELNSFAALQRQTLSSFTAEQERKKEEESSGKSEAEKKEIEKKYTKIMQDKAQEINQAYQAKKQELQDKLNAELSKADESLRQAIAAVAASKDLKLVLVKTAVYYGGVDITADVIAKGGQTKK